MASYFFDTSALAKFYHQEIGAAAVCRIVQTGGNQIRISRLAVVEMLSVIAIKVRTQVISAQEAGLVLRQLREDVSRRRFDVIAVRDMHFASAEGLLGRHAFDRRLRASDAIQLAVALGLKSDGLADHFVASDKTLCEVAVIEGFSVINPEQP